MRGSQLYQRAAALPAATFEAAFGDCYSAEGRLAKPVRLMVGLLLARNYLRGFAGDSRKLLLAAAAWTSASGCGFGGSFSKSSSHPSPPATPPPANHVAFFRSD